MKMRKLAATLGLLAVLTGSIGATARPALAQDDTGVAAKPGRGKEFYKEQVQLFKEMVAFFNDPANSVVLTGPDVLTLGKLTVEFSGGGQRRRPTRPGKGGGSIDAGEYFGKSLALAVEIYSRQHPGNHGALRQHLLRGLPMNPAQQRTMHQFSDKLMEQIKPYVPTGGNGASGNPRARQGRGKRGGANQRTGATMPPSALELAMKSFGQLSIMAEQYCEDMR